MKFKTALRASSIAACIAFTPLVSAQTLQEVLQETIDNNPEVQSARSERRAVENEIDQAKSEYFPTIDIAAGIGWEQSSNPTTRSRKCDPTGGGCDNSVSYGREETSIQLRQMIFDGLATPSEVERHKARTNARAYTVFGRSEITALSAVEAYINVLRRQELLDLAEENLMVHQRTNDQIVLRSDRGIGRKADADQSAGRLSLAEKNVLSEVGNLKDAKTAFLRVVGSLPKELEEISAPDDALPESIDEAVEQAVQNHPILKSANSDVDSALAQHKTARAAYMPRIDFEAGASHNNDLDGIKGKNEDAFAMLRLRYNIFKGGKDYARRKETAQLINQAKNIRDNTYRQVVESMRLSWVAYQTIKSQMTFFEGHRDAIIKTNLAYQKQFNIGQRTLLDLLDTANEMYVAKSAYTNAKYDVLFSQYRILASKGFLNRYAGVKLPEEIKTLEEAENEI